jgi:hypothetical protein
MGLAHLPLPDRVAVLLPNATLRQIKPDRAGRGGHRTWRGARKGVGLS